MSIIKAKSEVEVAAAISAARGPVVIDFFTTWCPYCRADSPNVRRLAKAHPDITVIMVDVDRAEALADAWGVKAMPTLYYAATTATAKPGKAQEFKNAGTLEAALKKPSHR